MQKINALLHLVLVLSVSICPFIALLKITGEDKEIELNREKLEKSFRLKKKTPLKRITECLIKS